METVVYSVCPKCNSTRIVDGAPASRDWDLKDAPKRTERVLCNVCSKPTRKERVAKAQEQKGGKR